MKNKYILGRIDSLNYKSYEKKFNELASQGYKFEKSAFGFLHKFIKAGSTHSYQINHTILESSLSKSLNLGKLEITKDSTLKNDLRVQNNNITFFIVMLAILMIPSFTNGFNLDNKLLFALGIFPFITFIPVAIWYLLNMGKLNRLEEVNSINPIFSHLYYLGLLVSIINAIRYLVKNLNQVDHNKDSIISVIFMFVLIALVVFLGFYLYDKIQKRWLKDSKNNLGFFLAFMIGYVLISGFVVFMLTILFMSKMGFIR
ncbi:MAG: hypothetical protein GXY87_06285 [Tissierellia bacterium]|nr:hypothetical protein [Tissierellia bacterium]